MKEFLKNFDSLRIVQISLIIATVILALNNIDGWGWLLFILFITL